LWPALIRLIGRARAQLGRSEQDDHDDDGERNLGLSPALYRYLLDVSLREPDVLRQLREETGRLDEGGMQIACDVSAEWTSIGRPYWQKAGVAHKIELRLAPGGENLAALRRRTDCSKPPIAKVTRYAGQPSACKRSPCQKGHLVTWSPAQSLVAQQRVEPGGVFGAEVGRRRVIAVVQLEVIARGLVDLPQRQRQVERHWWVRCS